MSCKKGDHLVLVRVRGGWFTPNTGCTLEEAQAQSDQIFASGMTERNNAMVVQVVEVKEREFDPR